MKIWRFENFIELVKRGSINGAAEKLHISPQALHQQMDTLENEVGCKLLVRSRKGVKLTAAGVVFYDRIGNLVNEYKLLINDTLAENQKELNTIRNVSGGLFDDFLYTNALVELKKLHPEIIPTFSYATHVESDTCEVILNSLEYPPESYTLFSSVQMDCFIHVQHTHRLARKNTVSIDDLLGETLMVVNPELLDQLQFPFWKTIREHASQLRIEGLNRTTSGDIMVLSTNGIYLCWGPQRSLHPFLRQIKVDNSKFDYMMLYNKAKYNSSKNLRVYLEFIGRYYQEHWKTEYDKIIGNQP